MNCTLIRNSLTGHITIFTSRRTDWVYTTLTLFDAFSNDIIPNEKAPKGIFLYPPEARSELHEPVQMRRNEVLSSNQEVEVLRTDESSCTIITAERQ